MGQLSAARYRGGRRSRGSRDDRRPRQCEQPANLARLGHSHRDRHRVCPGGGLPLGIPGPDKPQGLYGDLGGRGRSGCDLVVAVFYTAEVELSALTGAGIATLLLVGLNRLGILRLAPYLFLGAALGGVVLLSGITRRSRASHLP